MADGARGRREAIRQLADLRRRLATAEDTLADALAAMKQAEGAFDAASDRFDAAERALDAAREERAQARRDRYAARQAYERASTAADRLTRRVRELAERLERVQLRVLAWRSVAVPLPDRLRIVAIPALPRRTAGGLIRQDHAVPARCFWLGDPLDDPALPPPAADPNPNWRVPWTLALFAPGDAGTGPARVRDAHRCQYPKPCSESRGMRCGWSR